MKRIIFIVIIFAFVGLFAMNAQNTLKFRADGKFKIVQFTDVHYIKGDSRSDIALENMRAVLKSEMPDLVIITGDLIFGKPAREGLRDVLNVVSEFKIPFGFTFGNHDDESGLSRTELIEATKDIPYNLTSTTPGIYGTTNYVLPVISSKSNDTKSVVYVFDSNAYSKIEGVKGYDYIHTDQINWYRSKSKEYTASNGGTPVPSVAFFHIPFPEYIEALSDHDARFVGSRMEFGGHPKINSGLFTSMLEMGDMIGTFAGHDHDSDFAAYWYGILLCYGRYSGGTTVYNHLGLNGGRVIELIEGERSFNTWIRLRDGSVINSVKYPDNFVWK